MSEKRLKKEEKKSEIKLALKRFKRYYIKKGEGTKESNEHTTWVSPVPKKKKDS